MKTDLDLQMDIIDALAWEPAVDCTGIIVTVKDGIATMRGRAPSYADRSAAEGAARKVRGIRAIANDIAVGVLGAALYDDTAIAEAVADAIAWDSAVPLNAITAAVTDGWVTLTGAVEWQYQKSAAQVAAERMNGVKGVVNLVTLKARPTPADVKTRIENAFKRSALIDATQIKVEARDSTVVLTGTVRSLTERGEAERAAWCAPGVTNVEDLMTVSPY